MESLWTRSTRRWIGLGDGSRWTEVGGGAWLAGVQPCQSSGSPGLAAKGLGARGREAVELAGIEGWWRRLLELITASTGSGRRGFGRGNQRGDARWDWGRFIGLGWEVRRPEVVNDRWQSWTSMPSKFQFSDVREEGGCAGYGRGRVGLGGTWAGVEAVAGWRSGGAARGCGRWRRRRRLPEEEDEQHWICWAKKAKLGLEASWAGAAGIKGEKE
jgi:hypothetical protein